MPHVAVAGAGIGGLAAALALAKAGLSVTIVERAPVLGEAGAGLQLSPNACTALRDLGVLADVETEAVKLESLRLGRGSDGDVLARLPLGEGMLRRFGAPFLVTRRADLHGALRRRVEASAAISLMTDAPLAGWAEKNGRLRLAFEGPSRPPLDANALVGADGLHSTVRAKLAPGTSTMRIRGTAWRTTIEAEAVPAWCRDPSSNLWLGRGAHLVHYPVARGRLINVIAAIDGKFSGRDGIGDPAEIAGRFSGWATLIRDLLDLAPSWGTWPLADRAPLPNWSKGAVTLLGDAAHPMLPFLAQGAAQAPEDAVALGEAVAAKPDDLPQAFRDYERRRLPRTTRVQSQSRRQAMIYHLPSPASMARDMVLRATPAHRLLSRYDWLYAEPSSASKLTPN